MFSNLITNSDVFLDMNMSAQALYFHLNMNADDDWFVSPKRIMRMIWSPDDDIKLLVMKWFVLPFSDWVIVITHWKVNNNQIKLDRYTPTVYQEHLRNMSCIDKVYALELVGVQNGDILEPKSRVEKNRIEKNRVENIIPPSADFENFWKSFPHARKWKKYEAEKNFNKLKQSDVVEEVKLLNRKIVAGLQDPNFIPACERWIRDFTKTSDIVVDSTLKQILQFLKTKEWEERIKLSQWLKKDFGTDRINSLRNSQQEKIKLTFVDDNGKKTTF